jgi:hypothetical protein
MCASSTVRVEAAAAAADSAAGAAAVSVVSSAVCYVIKARKSMLENMDTRILIQVYE